MMRIGIQALLRVILILPVLGTALSARNRVAYVEFFGYTDVDVDAVRTALPFHAGDDLSKDLKDQASATVKRLTGRDPTNFRTVCCVDDGNSVVFIGLPGSSSHIFRLNPPPAGDAAPAGELSALYAKSTAAEIKAIQSGNSDEDGSPGYRLLKEPGAQAAELAVRAYVLQHQDEVMRVLESSGKADQRAMAADALGYGARNSRQMAALVYASRDPDSEVRNNSTRALSEILRADPSVAADVPPDTFIDMVRSETWSDRNKGCLTLWPLTQSRDPKVLARIKSESSDALWEIARWRNIGWAFCARAVLGRIAGIPEERLNPLAAGPLDAFAAAIGH